MRWYKAHNSNDKKFCASLSVVVFNNYVVHKYDTLKTQLLLKKLGNIIPY